jgi:hypothetical protein
MLEKEICYKYLSKNRKRCPKTSTLNNLGSPIWNLIHASMSLIQNHLRWSPRNGKKNKISMYLLSRLPQNLAKIQGEK